jgi:hypothetical protein
MFYVRENLLYVLVNALQERYYGFPNSMSRRLANACALLTKLRKLPDSRRNSGAVLFTTPRDDHEFCYSKNTACDSRRRTSSSVAALSRLETTDSETTNCSLARGLDAPHHEGAATALAQKIAEIAHRISSAKLCSYKTYEGAEKPTNQIRATLRL